MKLLTAVTRILAAGALICIVGPAIAQQDYPIKPINFLIPFPPGTGNDVVGRIVANKLSEYIGQRVIADNRAGASGNIAVGLAHRAAPDGYTLVMASTSASINQYTMKENYPLADFTPVARIGFLPYTLVVTKSMPAKNIKELAALMKSGQDRYNAASGGPTGTSFFLVESFKKAAGFDIQMVAYKGTTAAVVDLLADRTHILFAPMVTSLPHYRAGKIQVLGVTGSKRSPLMPDVPTFIESGYPTLDIPTWFALLGPAGVPGDVVKRLSASVAKVMASKDVIDSLTKVGVDPSFGTPAELDAFLKADTAMWAKMVKEAGIKPQ
ncbi:MAG: tripartite tricarboxylate transporter substrate binding protein [Pseudomonadota bacterium]